MTDRIDTDKLAEEMLDGLKGVSAGKWSRYEGSLAGNTHVVMDDNGEKRTFCTIPWDRKISGNAHRDAEYIALCCPDSIRAILTERTRFKAALTEISNSTEHADYLRRIAEDALGEGK